MWAGRVLGAQQGSLRLYQGRVIQVMQNPPMFRLPDKGTVSILWVASCLFCVGVIFQKVDIGWVFRIVLCVLIAKKPATHGFPSTESPSCALQKGLPCAKIFRVVLDMWFRVPDCGVNLWAVCH